MKQLSLHVTDTCNSKCGFCVVGSPLAQKDAVHYPDLVRFLFENAEQGYTSVNFHGGEPTIHPKLFELLNLARLFGYPEVHIQTNGRKLKDSEFVRKLQEGGVRLFIVSLHGFHAETQDMLAQVRGGFEETLEGIRNAKRLGIPVRTNTVLTKQNLYELDQLVGLCGELDVDHVNISNLHPVGSGFFAIDGMGPAMAETREVLLPAVERLLAMNRRVSLEGFPFCVVRPYQHLSIEWEKRDIRMMYHGSVYDNYDTYMDQECRTYGPACQQCSCRGLCGGVYKEYAERRGWSEFAPLPAASR
ncbi:MAG: radical SAM protein [Bryobacterales bacterium]|nr:radical SAM protein [Bryobacterales bacterium]